MCHVEKHSFNLLIFNFDTHSGHCGAKHLLCVHMFATLSFPVFLSKVRSTPNFDHAQRLVQDGICGSLARTQQECLQGGLLPVAAIATRPRSLTDSHPQLCEVLLYCFVAYGSTYRARLRNFMSTSANNVALTIPISSIVSQRH